MAQGPAMGRIEGPGGGGGGAIVRFSGRILNPRGIVEQPLSVAADGPEMGSLERRPVVGIS